MRQAVRLGGLLPLLMSCTAFVPSPGALQQAYPVRRGRSLALSAAARAPETTQVVIVGAGIGGLTLAYDLERRGIDYLVLEKAKSPREGGTAIGLWSQAWKALDYMGIGDRLRKPVYEGKRIRIGTAAGRELTSFTLDQCDYGPHEFRYVMRSDLLKELLKIVPAKRVRYSAELDGITELDGGEGAVVTLQGGKQIRTQVVVGADGVKSRVHETLFPSESSVNYSGYKAIRGIAKINPKAAGGSTLEQGVVSQIWGSGVRLGIFRMSPSQVYWFVTYNSGPGLEPSEKDPAGLLDRASALLGEWDESYGIDSILSATKPGDVLLTRLGDRWPKLGGWGKGRVTLIGDAAHPMTPNLGQGGAAAIEDALELGPMLASVLRPSTTATEVSAALRSFEKDRSPRCAKLTVKSAVFGILLQLDIPPVPLVRDTLLPVIFSPRSFLEHTKWSPPAAAQAAKPVARR